MVKKTAKASTKSKPTQKRSKPKLGNLQKFRKLGQRKISTSVALGGLTLATVLAFSSLAYNTKSHGGGRKNTTPTPTPTVATANATPTQSTNATLTSTPTITLSSPTPTQAPVVSGGYIFINPTELMSKPTSGTGWDFLKSKADMSSYGVATLSDQDSKTQTYTLAGALVYARTGNTQYRDKVIATIKQVCGTEGYSTLALARTLYGYVLAADLVKMDYATLCNNGQSWGTFLSEIRTKTMGGNSRWYNLEFTSEDSASNWGTYALPTHLAVSYALGDSVAINRDLNIYKRYLGDTTSPAGAFKPSASYRYPAASGVTTQSNGVSWDMSQNATNPVALVYRGINPYSASDGRNGAIVEDVLRGDTNSVPCCTPTSTGIGYTAEALDGSFSTFQLFLAHGLDLRGFQDSALRRAYEYYMSHGGPAPSTQSYYFHYFIHYFYGTATPTPGDGTHRHLGYGTWLYSR